jgi:acetyl esterase
MRPRGRQLRPGIRVLDRVMRASPMASVARMDEATLARAQAAAIPDRGPISLLLGRPRRDVRITTGAVPTPDGELPLRIYSPTAAGGAAPVIVSYHGGGFALGSARQGDWMCTIAAAQVGAVVVAVDYRLAPAHRFPAAVEDCYATLCWVAAHAADLGGDPARLAVMGDSAGGNLAAVVTLRARAEGGPALAHQTLIYPAVDLSPAILDTVSYRANDHGIVLSHDDMAIFNGHYVAAGTDPLDWRLSPLHAPDLSGLPPATVVVAGLDPLHDVGVAYADRLAAAGIPVTVLDYPQMPHGFLSFPYLSRSARPAMAGIVAAQAEALGATRR